MSKKLDQRPRILECVETRPGIPGLGQKEIDTLLEVIEETLRRLLGAESVSGTGILDVMGERKARSVVRFNLMGVGGFHRFFKQTGRTCTELAELVDLAELAIDEILVPMGFNVLEGERQHFLSIPRLEWPGQLKGGIYQDREVKVLVAWQYLFSLYISDGVNYDADDVTTAVMYAVARTLEKLQQRRSGHRDSSVSEQVWCYNNRNEQLRQYLRCADEVVKSAFEELV